MDIKELDKIEGTWHLASHPENKVNGRLYLENRILQVITSSHFCGKFFFREDLAEGFTICGCLQDGRKITLLGCLMIKHCSSLSADFSKDYEIYKPSSVVIGDWITYDKEIFMSAAAHYSLIDSWHRGFRCLLTVTKDDVTVDTNFCSTDINVGKESEDKINLAFASDSPMTIERILDEIDDIAKFFTCLLGKRCVYQNSIYLQSTDGKWMSLTPNFTREFDSTLDQTIQYEDMEDVFINIVKCWWGKKEQLKVPISLFTDSCIYKRWELIPEFLKMVQALEVYSRRIKMEPLMPEEEFKNMITAILSDITDEHHKKWLEKTLHSYRGYNEPTCAKRHLSLYKNMFLLMGIPLSKRQLKSISYKIVNTRNYYTHFTSNEGIYDDKKIAYATIFMKHLLWAYILSEFEIPMRIIAKYIQEASKLHYALQQLTDYNNKGAYY